MRDWAKGSCVKGGFRSTRSREVKRMGIKLAGRAIIELYTRKMYAGTLPGDVPTR
jgi:hypothetical protein